MAQLRITCFHAFHATIDEQPVAFRSNTGRALLLYLAVEPTRVYTRSALAGLLWPDLPENHARRNLSQTLLEVRKAIGDQTTQLPPHFLGRADEIATLCQGLCRSDQPVWAVVGMGGLGKTALALRVAHELRATFTDGVLWANTATSNPLDILNQWGRAFGCDLQSLPDLEIRAAAMRGILAEKRLLLVLDNVEAISTLTLLLPNARDCRVLITTRSLDLAHALDSQILALGQLMGNGGYDLLAAILGTARVQAEAEAAHAICHILHSLPLALEIVAQRLRARPRITLAAMVERLSTEGQRLGLAISNRAVRTSFAISWDGLDDAQQRAFAHMALFAGRPFTATAFSYLLNADHVTTEDLLYDLVALSLLQAEGESYFRQHPLLADFASEKLGTDDAAHRRYIHYYLHFATEKAHLYEALEAEWGNLADAVAKAHSLGAWQSPQAEALCLITEAPLKRAVRECALAQLRLAA